MPEAAETIDQVWQIEVHDPAQQEEPIQEKGPPAQNALRITADIDEVDLALMPIEDFKEVTEGLPKADADRYRDIRRRVKNKISADKSRRRREERRAELKREVEELRGRNRALREEQRRLQQERAELKDGLATLELNIQLVIDKLPEERAVHLAAAFHNVVEEGPVAGTSGFSAAEQVGASKYNKMFVV